MIKTITNKNNRINKVAYKIDITKYLFTAFVILLTSLVITCFIAIVIEVIKYPHVFNDKF